MIMISVPKLRGNEHKSNVSPEKRREDSPKHIPNGKKKQMKLKGGFLI